MQSLSTCLIKPVCVISPSICCLSIQYRNLTLWTLRHEKQDSQFTRVTSLTPVPFPPPTRLQILPSLSEGLGGRNLRVVVKEVRSLSFSIIFFISLHANLCLHVHYCKSASVVGCILSSADSNTSYLLDNGAAKRRGEGSSTIKKLHPTEYM